MNLLRTLSFLVTIFIGCHEIHAQEPVQTIRGRIIDKATLTPLEGASVVLSGTEPLIGTVTDSSGYFRLEKVKTGRYIVKVTYIGYQEQVIHDLLLNAGKELVLEIGLAEKFNTLDEIVITAGGRAGNNPVDIDYLSSRVITIEETQRYAATFYDPARVVISSPGVIVTNDQANNLVVRGNSPNGILWRIEGADVVNPNHLTNAGTFSDKPTLSGGGVAILSTQLMSNSKFLSGAFPAEYGNALSGVFDIHLRKGNNKSYEFTGQASLLGIDLAAEGPFSKKSGGSFLFNYRYSTLGLFTLAGIPLGDEIINFQDLSFNISLPTNKAGEFTFFGLGGTSITRFNGLRDSSEWAFQKERTDVDFYSDMGAIGLTHEITLGQKSGVNSSIAISGINSGRTENYISDAYSSILVESDKLSQNKVSFSSFYFHKLNAHHLFKTGIIANKDDFGIDSKKAIIPGQTLEILHKGNAGYSLFQPYLHWQYTISSRLLLNSGLHYVYSDLNRSQSFEPRVSLKWDLNTVSFITAGYGLHSQMQHPATYFNTVASNRDLGFTKAHHWITGFTKRFSESLIFRSELYYQYLFHVPVSTDVNSSFSALNLLEISVMEELTNKGTGKNYGIDLSLERFLKQGYYFLFAGSIYNSLYTGADGIERNTRFNGNYLLSLTSGKEFKKARGDKNKVFGVNIRLAQIGGFRYTPVDVAESRLAGKTVYNDEKAFSEQLDDFFRTDIRFSWRKNKLKYTRTFAIDIQNLTNHKNPAYHYYDIQQKSLVTRYQLGIIPFISYRVEF